MIGLDTNVLVRYRSQDGSPHEADSATIVDDGGFRPGATIPAGEYPLFRMTMTVDLPCAPDVGEAWAVVCPNWFEVRIGEGLFSLSHASVWWRE